MAKKRAKKVIKGKKAVKVKKAVRAKRASRAVKVKAKSKEKVLGRVEHYFDHISVAAIAVKAPIKVGDIIRIKGHTTDFVQRIESMQIEHNNVLKVKKGDDVGIRVKEKVRDHDLVYQASEKDLLARPAAQPVVQPTPPVPPKPSDPYSSTRFLI